MRSTTSPSRRRPRNVLPALTLLLVMCGSVAVIYPGFIGSDNPESFSLCEEAEDATGAPRQECQAADIRYDQDDPAGEQFGFSLAAGLLNGDDLVDVVVGDPSENKVYIFYGRPSAQEAYGLAADALDRGVSPATGADLILYRDPAIAGQVTSFGYSVAISAPQEAEGCASSEQAAALLIGAPGIPGETPDGPGTVFHIPAGNLCLTPSNPPATQTIDPGTIGQSFVSPDPEQDDDFGYSVAFGRLLTGTETGLDVIAGAPGASNGAGRVTGFPVVNGTVDLTDGKLVKIEGLEGDGLGEVLATGDLDQDFDADTEPGGDLDDLAVGAVGHDPGKVILAQGPLSPTGGSGGNGVFQEGVDTQIRAIAGELSGDFFGFSLAISAQGHLAVGGVLANNVQPADGGDGLTNARTGGRINAGKVYVWDPGFLEPGPELAANTAGLVFVARRSGDQLGFSVAFDDLDGSETDDLIMAARREDGTGLTVDEIDQGTVYVVLDMAAQSSPVDLNLCAANSDCSGVNGIEVMIFGGDRQDGKGDEIGFALAAGNFNGDSAADLFVSTLTQNRVYVVTLEDTDDDRAQEGRNIRDEDDDEDGDPDATDCAPLDPEISSAAEEIPCNGIDENCNGLEDDRPDADGDGFDACGETGPADCDDGDRNSYPDAPELCDGNDNACGGVVPADERDVDSDGYVACSGWNDAQGDQPEIFGGDDCDAFNAGTFPGAADRDDPAACMRDSDDDGFGDESPPSGVIPGTDCDDTRADTFVGAAPSDDPNACLRDADGDGWGDASAPSPVPDGTDCDDDDATSYPGAPEQCDGNDNACAGTLGTDEIDTDADGYVACSGWNDTQGDDVVVKGGGDCDTADSATYPGAAPNEADPAACMTDKDGDDYGDLSPADGIPAGTDCDDDSETAADTFPGAAAIDGPLNCMKDSDGDEYGDDSVSLPVVAGNDCNDEEPAQFAGADEIADDGIDQDCNGFDTVTCYEDADGDGYGVEVPLLAGDGDCNDPGESPFDTDCDDTTAAISPGVEEIVGDGIDQDCNGFDTVVCFVDGDGDGFGTTLGTSVLADDGSCDADDMESGNDSDCDDADPATFPAAPEQCDGNDNTCAGTVPLEETDQDGDTYVECSGWNDTQGDHPAVSGGNDCAPTDGDIFPGAAENESTPTACMKDNDGDGYGDLTPPEGVTPGTDCDDSSALGDVTFPGAAPGDNPLNCMRDADGDDYGDTAVSLPIVPGTDCDDGDGTTFPGAPELCDGDDNTCQGSVPTDEVDSDADGYVICLNWSDGQGNDPGVLGGGDCDDASAATFPGAAASEVFTGACMKDADGDEYGDLGPPEGVTPGTDCDDDSATAADTFPGAAAIDGPLNCMKDSDGDDYGDSASALPVVAGTDCDDDEAAANPGALEGPPGDATCSEGIDNDCDGDVDDEDLGCQVTLPCPDDDSDGFADCTSDPLCDSTGLTCGDCDDGNFDINPDGTEVCDNADNDCNGTVDEGFDADDDGFTTCALPFADCNDGDPQVNPGEQEVCNDGVDNDCDVSTPDLFDSDGDGATCEVDCDDGNAAKNLADADSDGYSTCDGDCDDGNNAISPGELEVCNDGIDNDCNPATLDVGDADGDGATCEVDCDDTDPGLNLDDADSDTFSTCAGDCDDGDAAINPAAADVCDGVDNDCNGTVDDDFDVDDDGYSTCDLPVPDCNDANPSINPGEDEVCNDGIDNDCNPATEDLGDGDGDGFACNVDCDDADRFTYPGASEQCDGNVNACGGTLPADEVDADSDGYVACSGWSDTQGDDPEILGGDDCDTADADTFPGSSPNEVFAVACMRDRDGDDYGDQMASGSVTPGTDCDDSSATAADTFPGAAAIDGPDNCMKDSDDDDYGDEFVILPIVPGFDCADDDAARNPGATEVCGDGVDSDCDGADPVCPAATVELSLDDTDSLNWTTGDAGATYSVYRGDLETLRTSGIYTQEPGSAPEAERFCGVSQTSLVEPFQPEAGGVVFYLVAPRTGSGDASLGTDSQGGQRPNTYPCDG